MNHFAVGLIGDKHGLRVFGSISEQMESSEIKITFKVIFYTPTRCSLGIGDRRILWLSTKNSPAKFCLFPEKAFPFHNNPSVTL